MQGAEVIGELPSYPLDLLPGHVMNFSLGIGVQGNKIATTQGKNTVTAKERLTTPAGGFDCVKIESEVSTKVLIINRKVGNISWLAPGVGTVRAEYYDDKGRLESTKELISLKL
jgi:hypothetical protein